MEKTYDERRNSHIMWFLCISVLFLPNFSKADDSNCMARIYDVTFTAVTYINYTSFIQHRDAKCVNVSHNDITSLNNDTFVKHWDIRTLDLSYNHISELPPHIFSSMLRLEFLHVTHNKLMTLPLSLFEGTPKLKLVDFSNNKLNHIPLQVFNYSLQYLKHVILKNNSLTAFEPWNYVSKPVKPRQLDLRWNNISSFTNEYNLTIEDDGIRTIYDVVLTDIRYNSMRHWKDNNLLQYFRPSRGVTIDVALGEVIVDLRDNLWICDCNVHPLVTLMDNSVYKWTFNDRLQIKCYDPPELRGKRIIYDVPRKSLICNITKECPAMCICQDEPEEKFLKIDCSSKNLNEFPKIVPKNVYSNISIQFDDNLLERLENISFAHQIVNLTMQNNNLQYIDGKVFKEMSAEKSIYVDFRNNHLKSLPEEIQVLQFQNAKLDNNQLQCDCDMLWMVDWINLAPKGEDKSLECSYEGAKYKIADLDGDMMDCSNTNSILLIIILTSLLALVIVLLITAKRCPYETKVLLYKIFRIHPADKYIVDETTDKHYDMYISFDEEDPYLRQWVKRVLVRELEEKKPFYKLCLSCRDLSAGTEAEARLDLMEKSKRLLVILSERFENNNWCAYESNQSECLDQIEGRIMYLLYDTIAEKIASEEPWKSRISGRKCFTVGERMMWSKLRYELPVKGRNRII